MYFGFCSLAPSSVSSLAWLQKKAGLPWKIENWVKMFESLDVWLRFSEEFDSKMASDRFRSQNIDFYAVTLKWLQECSWKTSLCIFGNPSLIIWNNFNLDRMSTLDFCRLVFQFRFYYFIFHKIEKEKMKYPLSYCQDYYRKYAKWLPNCPPIPQPHQDRVYEFQDFPMKLKFSFVSVKWTFIQGIIRPRMG